MPPTHSCVPPGTITHLALGSKAAVLRCSKQGHMLESLKRALKEGKGSHGG